VQIKTDSPALIGLVKPRLPSLQSPQLLCCARATRKQMSICGFTFSRNGQAIGRSVPTSTRSPHPLCDELIVNVSQSAVFFPCGTALEVSLTDLSCRIHSFVIIICCNRKGRNRQRRLALGRGRELITPIAALSTHGSRATTQATPLVAGQSMAVTDEVTPLRPRLRMNRDGPACASCISTHY
jgi:hypothetical protein